MAVEQEVAAVLARELAPDIRYRCLLFQCRAMGSIDALREAVQTAHMATGLPALCLSHADMFPAQIPLTAARLVATLTAAERERSILIVGPLHVSDCWTEVGRSVLWQHLAAFTGGPGIVVIDVPRPEVAGALFHRSGRLRELPDVEYLRSRLSPARTTRT